MTFLAKNLDKRRPLRALFPGSFDPVTFGHIDIVRRFAPFFDLLTVLVSSAAHKTHRFSLSERTAAAREVFRDFPRTAVDSFSGLTADYARQNGVSLILRGARSIHDFEMEKSMAQHNRKAGAGSASDSAGGSGGGSGGGPLETILVFARPETAAISSRLVREIAAAGGDLSDLIPKEAVRLFQTAASKKGAAK